MFDRRGRQASGRTAPQRRVGKSSFDLGEASLGSWLVASIGGVARGLTSQTKSGTPSEACQYERTLVAKGKRQRLDSDQGMASQRDQPPHQFRVILLLDAVHLLVVLV